MKLCIISFTLNGSLLNQKLHNRLEEPGVVIRSFGMEPYAGQVGLEPVDLSLREWTGKMFEGMDGIIFIGAAGIAVRAIAPFLVNKTVDPAVVVMDEKGQFVIPILSGHLGGANELAMKVAECIGGIPVITTATDVNSKFAVDVFARKNHLFIDNMMYAKEVSAAVLNNQSIGVVSEFPICGEIPDGLDLVHVLGKTHELEVVQELEATLESGTEQELDAALERGVKHKLNTVHDKNLGICISIKKGNKPFPKTLNLIPNVLTLGIGCRKGKTKEEIEKAVLTMLNELDLSLHSIRNGATIDLKKEEAGLLEFCESYKLPLSIYSSDELLQVQGDFSESEYVKSVTGVGNVCERAAILGSNNGTLIQKKIAGEGITLALAMTEWSVSFE